MKHIQNFLVRSVCAIGAGVILIMYRDQAIEWFTIGCGTLFFISGLISCAFYLGQRSHMHKETMYDTNGNPVEEKAPMFPLVGIGSIVLGAILVFMRDSFAQWGIYILSGLLILGSISQYMSLARARKYCSIGAFYWIVATMLLLIGLVVICKLEWIVNFQLKIIGWSFMVYGVMELIVGWNVYRAQRRLEKEMKARQQAQEEAERAMIEDAQAEEITEEEVAPEAEDNIEDAEIVEEQEPEIGEKIDFNTTDETTTGDAF